MKEPKGEYRGEEVTWRGQTSLGSCLSPGKAGQMREREISYAEYRLAEQLAGFRCPKDPNSDIRFCDGLDCPSRGQPVCGCQEKAHIDQPSRCPWREENYFDECRRARDALLLLLGVLEGKVRIRGYAVRV